MARPVSAGTARADDITAKARIRNAALELFARDGVEGTSLRAVAAAAGVTVGLIVHHYGTKEALREAVELAIVEQFADAIASVPL
ncbi:MAG: TetR family transcriptional regulator, partial [Actinomycetota bacterium]